jgi:hypothetical protein
MKVTYTRVNSPSVRGEIIEARYKNVIMELEEGDDLVFIYGMESSNQGKGECQEMIDLIKEDFKGKRLCGSPPLSAASKHIFDKMGVNYVDYQE